MRQTLGSLNGTSQRPCLDLRSKPHILPRINPTPLQEYVRSRVLARSPPRDLEFRVSALEERVLEEELANGETDWRLKILDSEVRHFAREISYLENTMRQLNRENDDLRILQRRLAECVEHSDELQARQLRDIERLTRLRSTLPHVDVTTTLFDLQHSSGDGTLENVGVQVDGMFACTHCRMKFRDEYQLRCHNRFTHCSSPESALDPHRGILSTFRHHQ